MKVYAITNDLELLKFNSVKEFEANHSWVDDRFIKCVSSRDLKESQQDGILYQETNDGDFIQMSENELAANKILNQLISN